MTEPLSRREFRDLRHACHEVGLRIPVPVRMIIGGWRKKPDHFSERAIKGALRDVVHRYYVARRRVNRGAAQ